MPTTSTKPVIYVDARLGGHSQGIATCEETDRIRADLVIFTSQTWPDPSWAVTQTAEALRPGRC
jgi:hypothetical protein